MIYQYFIGGMMPDSANPVQQSVTVIEIRPFKGGWQCYEARVSDLTGLAILRSALPKTHRVGQREIIGFHRFRRQGVANNH
jgi:hypothetical protein